MAEQPKRKRKKAEHDFSLTAFRVVEESTDECPSAAEPRNAKAAGGKARASKLTPEQRKAIAKKAAKARWDRQAAP